MTILGKIILAAAVLVGFSSHAENKGETKTECIDRKIGQSAGLKFVLKGRSITYYWGSDGMVNLIDLNGRSMVPVLAAGSTELIGYRSLQTGQEFPIPESAKLSPESKKRFAKKDLVEGLGKILKQCDKLGQEGSVVVATFGDSDEVYTTPEEQLEIANETNEYWWFYEQFDPYQDLQREMLLVELRRLQEQSCQWKVAACKANCSTAKLVTDAGCLVVTNKWARSPNIAIAAGLACLIGGEWAKGACESDCGDENKCYIYNN